MIPPAVEPEQPPIRKAKAKISVVTLLQVSKLTRVNPLVDKILIKEKKLRRKLSLKLNIFC